MSEKSVLVTGAGGYVGRELLPHLATHGYARVVALDVREPATRVDGIEYLQCDVRDKKIADIMREHGTTNVIHLAGIVNPGKQVPREVAYAIDVDGTRNVLEACLQSGVQHFTTTSSGAAYGYYPDNPPLIDEDTPLRGNEEFAYAYHKRLVEELLAQYRQQHPKLKQLILRIATVLGERTDNQITALFDKPLVLGIRGSASPWVFVWDQDVINCIIKGVDEDHAGIYNVCGDGTVSMREIAKLQGKRLVSVPAGVIAGALSVMKKLNATQYGPEQVNFIRYRPVLSNARIKREWYTPEKSSLDAFQYFLSKRSMR